MSARKSWVINCDRCGQSDGGSLGFTRASDLRRVLRSDGWAVNLAGGQDLCEECRAGRPS